MSNKDLACAQCSKRIGSQGMFLDDGKSKVFCSKQCVEEWLEDIPPKSALIPKDPFTREEREIWNGIVKIHNAYMKSRGTTQEQQEWVEGIHRLQHILEHRVIKRLYPGGL